MASAPAAAPMDDAQFRAWKTQLVPLMYDWFTNHKLNWPSQACRWGPMLENHNFRTKHRIYISEQTNPDAGEPPKLLVIDCDIVKPNVASSEVVATWTELSRCPYMSEVKAITHPGEVNKIRELPTHPEVVVTHTDSPLLYVWNTATQPGLPRTTRGGGGGSNGAPPRATPDATLVGHEADALFPLATAAPAPLVASGGADKLLLLWDLGDLGDTSLTATAAAPRPGGGTKLQPRQKLRGHRRTVEDLVFQPGSTTHLASVGDDAQVLLWDTSSGSSPTSAIEKAHGSWDVHTVDWSGLDEHMLVTGAADGSLRVWDVRKLPGNGNAPGGALHVLTYHSDAIMRAEWHPSERHVLASGGEDHLVVVWDLSKAGGQPQQPPPGAPGAPASSRGTTARGGGAPPEVLFKHVGHRAGKVVDLQWCPASPWTMMSVSDDTAAGEGGASAARGGGGTLQLWRINDLLYLPEDQVVQELEAHREWILTGREPGTGKPRGKTAAAAAKREAAASGGSAAAQQALDVDVKTDNAPVGMETE